MQIPMGWLPPVVALQRVFELILSARNRRRLLSRGGREIRPETYRTMVALHVLFLASLAWESYPWRVPADTRTWACLAALVPVTVLRYWAIRTLGEHWTTRVIVVPGMRLIRRGPYRYLRHPNYVAIALEFFLLPLLMRAPVTLIVFSAANAVILRQRVRIEEEALRDAAQ